MMPKRKSSTQQLITVHRLLGAVQTGKDTELERVRIL